MEQMVGDAGRGGDCKDTARARYQGQDDQGDRLRSEASRNAVREVLRTGEASFEYERQVQTHLTAQATLRGFLSRLASALMHSSAGMICQNASRYYPDSDNFSD